MPDVLCGHPSVVRFVREYNPNLVVAETPLWVERGADPDDRYMLAQRVPMVHEIGGDGSKFYSVVGILWPQLYMPQVSEIDQRWIAALEGARLAKLKDLPRQRMEQEAEHIKAMEGAVDDNIDELHYAFQKQFAGYNDPCVKPVNPLDETRRMQDHLGRELR